MVIYIKYSIFSPVCFVIMLLVQLPHISMIALEGNDAVWKALHAERGDLECNAELRWTLENRRYM